MRVLVLGATGYLGGHTAGHLRAQPGVRVLGAGRAAGAGVSAEPSAGPHADPPVDLTVDLATATPAELASLIRQARPDAVVNCAGAVGGDALHLTGANARGPAALCAALREAAPGARLVHLGSAAEYGPGTPGHPLAEDHPTRPVGLYGAAKLVGTLAVTGSGLDAVVLRVFNPVGPGAPAASLPGRLAAELRRAGPDGVVRVGDLSAHRDFVDARDVARAATAAALAPGPLPPVLNIAAGAARAVRDVAEGLAAAAGFRGRIDEKGADSARSAAVAWQQADVAAAAGALGWRPGYALEESLADLWARAAGA
ncbi:NAD-dependent epimerase/dehydratase family protein [Streptomyces verrucosisporus]|uniref:NAD-dependent epimerase/dehydratase family protein n=1 Tax=Streptomyces verrucosisporus TaxID=1695161 RepID=UPI0019D11E25|nr:NAD-dependent epimerase/dehydratase family protein [Streptomyces verrucosisporus]MBN3929845.1 NAD-dependent epimerase/dehydratase family protein [Streptomyces verrucosisporus]